MAEIVYVLCALTSLACATLLARAWRRTRSRLLMWSALCFLCFTANNVLLYADRDLEVGSPYLFVHPRDARYSGQPVLDVKNAFHTALEDAGIEDFTWHDFRHDYASRLVMAGVSLRAVAELLGHKGLRMVMRYAHLSPGYLSDEIHKLDGFRLRQSTAAPATAPPSPAPEPHSAAALPRKRDGEPGAVREDPDRGGPTARSTATIGSHSSRSAPAARMTNVT